NTSEELLKVFPCRFRSACRSLSRGGKRTRLPAEHSPDVGLDDRDGFPEEQPDLSDDNAGDRNPFSPFLELVPQEPDKGVINLEAERTHRRDGVNWRFVDGQNPVKRGPLGAGLELLALKDRVGNWLPTRSGCFPGEVVEDVSWVVHVRKRPSPLGEGIAH